MSSYVDDELSIEEQTELYDYAKKAIEANVVEWEGNEYITAGSYHFRSIWVRDACHAAPGLSILKHDKIVKNMIDLYLEHLTYDDNSNGPKGFDTMHLESRVFWAGLRRCFCCPRRQLPFYSSDPLIPLYKDSRGSVAIDSNILILLSIFSCSGKDIQRMLNGPEVEKFRRMFDYYETFKNTEDDLIEQNAYSDWQDSQMRTGATFLTNLLFYEVSRRFILQFKLGVLSRHPGSPKQQLIASEKRLEALRRTIIQTFYDGESGLFRSIKGEEQISMDGNLLALRWGFSNDSKKLWKNLRNHDLWKGTSMSNCYSRIDCFCCCGAIKPTKDTGYPGFATYPDYPRATSALQVRLGGIQNYHDSLYWTWLMSLSGEIAYRYGDIAEGDRIAKNLLRIAKRDGTFAEVYAHHPNFDMYKTNLVISEHPFSWGSSYVLEMLQARFERMR